MKITDPLIPTKPLRKLKLTLLPVLLLALPAVVKAQFNYTTNNGEITITLYTGAGGTVVIPDTIDGWPVTRVGDYAFNNCSALTNVAFPNSLTSIGNGAFQSTSLTNVVLPDNLTSIGI